MIADPPFTNGYYVEGGNIYGHIVFEEATRPAASPVEIGLKVKYRYWGSWIEYPEVRQWCYVSPDGRTPECFQARVQITEEFHRNEIDLGRAVHPILYRNRNPRHSFSRLNKTYRAMEHLD